MRTGGLAFSGLVDWGCETGTGVVPIIMAHKILL